MERYYFNPTPGTIYTNKGGGSYICLEAEGHFRAKFQRVSKYKWTFTANGCQVYEDGTIEWDGSTGGYFAEDEKTNEIDELRKKYPLRIFLQKTGNAGTAILIRQNKMGLEAPKIRKTAAVLQDQSDLQGCCGL